MKAVKIIVGMVVLIAVIVAAVVFYTLSNVNGFVEKMIESTGSELTQTSVGVGSVDLKLLEGSGAIYNLSIANPEGYSVNNLFLAKSISLSVDIESLTQPVKVIKSVNVGEISLLAEQKNIKDTNIQALLDNMKKAGGSSKKPADDSGSDVLIAINQLVFAATTIDLQTEKLGGKQVTLPSFTLRNIGSSKKGVTPKQAAEEITKQVMAKVKSAVKKELSGLLSDEAKAKLKTKLKDKLKKELSTDKLKSLFK